MNYLAHSLPFVFDDDALAPWRVAGTALPDWLRAVDRRARLRPDVLARAPVDDERHAALGLGARRHHDDDHRFHQADAFERATAELTVALRARAPGSRASALAHVLVELLVDAALLERHPTLLQRFYAAVDAIDDGVVADFVRTTTARPLPDVELFLGRFRRARFLAAYATDHGVLDCLRGVWLRAGIGDIDDGVVEVIAAARPQVATLVDELRW
jgi:hypothetical protein